MSDLPILYLPREKADSHPVAEFLEEHGVGYQDGSSASASEMSKQTGISEDEVEGKTPLLKWSDGTLLENCDRESLIAFLHDRGYQFEES